MNIPEDAVQAALEARLSFSNQRGMDNSANLMRHILEAAAPILLSHERQQTADAHRDAIVNRDTAGNQ
jgi:hypothetical protein